MERRRIQISGIVQGVGFRPFVYALAKRLELTGRVWNSADQVVVEVQGKTESLDSFIQAIWLEAPDVAKVLAVNSEILPELQPEQGFSIELSAAGESQSARISPDLAICPACASELANPADRRFGYAFINCTHCGPRFSIVEDFPYDRAKTTMRGFAMCKDCQKEYDDPLNRRFHAQPNACGQCGPQYWLIDEAGFKIEGNQAFKLARQAVGAGKILALQGLGGVHLVCDAKNEAAIALLRRRKGRPHKPLAIMAGSLAAVEQYCHVSTEEEKWLMGRVKPIVLLQRKQAGDLPENLAPQLSVLGVMLPYAPIHALLLEPDDLWVMTSGNASGEPLYYQAPEALAGLKSIAHCFLVHNRPIARPVEDSVVRVQDQAVQILRRSRGFVPEALPFYPGPAILACGGDLKNTFCLTKGSEAILSAHMGDLATLRGFEHYRQNTVLLQKLLHTKPQVLAHDLHPGYAATRFALAQDLPRIGVQHHHAHAATVLAEHGLFAEQALALIFDGTGYGEDGTIWGGEFLLASCRSYERLGYLKYRPLPGGDWAVREPWRQSLAFLAEHYADYSELPLTVTTAFPQNAELLVQAIHQLAVPKTSSAGRLFDLAASLLGLCQSTTYEGQAAILLEEAAQKGQPGILDYKLARDEQGLVRLDFDQALLELVEQQLKSGLNWNVADGAAVFQQTFCQAVSETAVRLAQDQKLSRVVLGGGVFQNQWVRRTLTRQLEQQGLTVLLNKLVPCNDGGLAFGQAAVARLRSEDHVFSCSR